MDIWKTLLRKHKKSLIGLIHTRLRDARDTHWLSMQTDICF